MLQNILGSHLRHVTWKELSTAMESLSRIVCPAGTEALKLWKLSEYLQRSVEGRTGNCTCSAAFQCLSRSADVMH